ncbi:LysR family transcriptional regulator [Rhizobium leguminosarum bv. viciae]|nr:LysR family transcriptional regulator [Rhizobium leguminosarum bv. viciae]
MAQNHRHLDWNDLRCVLAVAEHGGLAAAARALGVNHTTVLRRVNAFEEAQGLRLFERLPTGWWRGTARLRAADIIACYRSRAAADRQGPQAGGRAARRNDRYAGLQYPAAASGGVSRPLSRYRRGTGGREPARGSRAP